MTERESVYYAGLVLSFVPVRSTFDQESFYLKRKKERGEEEKKSNLARLSPEKNRLTRWNQSRSRHVRPETMPVWGRNYVR